MNSHRYSSFHVFRKLSHFNKPATVVDNVRKGTLGNNAKDALRARKVPKRKIPLTATMLFSTNKSVDRENQRRNRGLRTRSIFYKSCDSGKTTKRWMAPARLELKIGTRVMVLINYLHKLLTNGSRGTVKSFKTYLFDGLPILCPVVEFDIGVTIPVGPSASVQREAQCL